MSRIKVKVEFWYNTETNEIEVVSPSKIDSPSNNLDATITLESNKLVLNDAAISLLETFPNDRLTIQYHKDGNNYFPIIARDSTLNVKGGNLLTKSKTISCRGKANDKLSEYGSIFKLEEKSPGIFIMKGDKEYKPYKTVDSNIQIDEDLEHDLEKIDMSSDLDLDNIEEINFNDVL